MNVKIDSQSAHQAHDLEAGGAQASHSTFHTMMNTAASVANTVRRNPLRLAVLAGAAGYVAGRRTEFNHSLTACGKEGYSIYQDQISQHTAFTNMRIENLKSEHKDRMDICEFALSHAKTVNDDMLAKINADHPTATTQPANAGSDRLAPRGWHEDHRPAPSARPSPAPFQPYAGAIEKRGVDGAHHHRPSSRPSAKPKTV